jgi:hypothetical protein
MKSQPFPFFPNVEFPFDNHTHLAQSTYKLGLIIHLITMRPFQTISQIFIATSVISCVLAAPSAEETHDARTDIIQLERRLSTTAKTIFATAPFAGMVAGLIGGLASEAQKYIAAGTAHQREYVSSLLTLSCQCQHF